MSGWYRMALVALASAGLVTAPADADDAEIPPVLQFTMKAIDAKPLDLSKYAGKVVLIVNTASQCGFTPQYEGLQKLHEEFAGDGLAILGFPCNQFGKQEPGSEAEIVQFCKKNYGVTFDLFAKVEVNGDGQCELYRFLTSKETNPEFSGPIKWNFEKFLIGRDGKIAGRFRSPVAPESTELTKAIKNELAK